MTVNYTRCVYSEANPIVKTKLLTLLKELWFYESMIIHKKEIGYSAHKLNVFLMKMLVNSEYIICAYKGSVMVGFAMGSTKNDGGDARLFDLSVLVVSKDFRGNNIGKKLIELVKSTCRAKKVILSTLEDNEAAIKFYKANGFEFNEPPYMGNQAMNVKGTWLA